MFLNKPAVIYDHYSPITDKIQNYRITTGLYITLYTIISGNVSEYVKSIYLCVCNLTENYESFKPLKMQRNPHHITTTTNLTIIIND